MMVTDRLRREGARAVVLLGSFARGKPHAHSDIDLVVIGRGGHTFERRDGFLVSIARGQAREELEDFRSPVAVGKVIPGWREAELLWDPHGIARRIQLRAKRWRWRRIAPAAARRVASDLTHRSENVHKMVGCFNAGDLTSAAIQQAVLAIFLPAAMAIHLRLLYRSENRLWNEVSRRMGPGWRRHQRRALGLGGEPLPVRCRSTLMLYRLAATRAWRALNATQREMVSAARAIKMEGWRDPTP